MYSISMGNLARSYIVVGDYAAAQGICDRLLAHPNKNARALGRTMLALILIRQGSFKQALRALDFGLETDRLENCLPQGIATKLFMRARIDARTGDYRAAVLDAEASSRLIEQEDPYDVFSHIARGYVATAHALAGDTVKADSLAAELLTRFQEGDSTWKNTFWVQRGWYEDARGRHDAAISAFNKATDGYSTFGAWKGLADAYFKSGRLAEAVRSYERALKTYDATRGGSNAVLVYYDLGKVYEQSGWNDQAITQYETFLDIWKNADPGIPEVEDAQKRLEKLRNSSS